MKTPDLRNTPRVATISALILAATGIAIAGCDSPSAAPAVSAVQEAAELDSFATTIGPAAETPTAEEIQRRRESWVGSASVETEARMAASREPAAE